MFIYDEFLMLLCILASQRKIEIGDTIKVKKHVVKLKHGWGVFTHESKGKVKRFDKFNCLRVDFESDKDFGIMEYEVELVL